MNQTGILLRISLLPIQVTVRLCRDFSPLKFNLILPGLQRYHHSKMAAAPPLPCDIKTEPAANVVYNAPCCFDQKTCVRLTNLGAKKIGWQLKSNNLDRYGVEPASGVVKPQANVVVDVKARPFFFKVEECLNDRLTFEWVDVPEESAGEEVFNALWFSKAPLVRRHIMTIRFNP